MNPFEDLIRDLGKMMNLQLAPDAHQSCLITFPQDEISVQIDLDTNAEKILVGTQLDLPPPGPYRNKIFVQALRVNGMSQTPRGMLAFSEKNGTLVLFQFLSLASLNGEKLFHFLRSFCDHAKIWKEALTRGDVPMIEEDIEAGRSGMFGLNP